MNISSALFRASRALGVSLLLLSSWNSLLPVPPAPPVDGPEVPKSANEKAQELGISKREYKAQKREKQRQDMLKRVEQKGLDGTPLRRAPSPEVPASPPRPAELTEDFDGKVAWEGKLIPDDVFVSTGVGYGYSSANHLASVGCAPGEVGGTVSDNALSWYADVTADGPASLDLDTPLQASGWCVFTEVQGHAGFGWFSADTYDVSQVAPFVFAGWRQDGATIHPALGSARGDFSDGPPLKLSKDKPFQWSLVYTPSGGDQGCGLIKLRVDGGSSFLSLTPEQRKALAGRKLNRFGILTTRSGSETSTMWLDNLSYTRMAGLPAPHPDALVNTRTAFFDTDPTGSTFFAVNTLSPHQPATVVQDYGYRATGGRSGGCVGGKFSPAIGLGYYGYDYGAKQLHFSDKLRSEGWFQIPGYEGRNLHIGWTSKHGMSWHEPSTLAMRISSIGIKGQGRCINIAGEGTLKNYEGHGGAGWGTVTTLSAGPEWHHYLMEFDPKGAFGLGTFTIQIDDTAKVFYFGEDKIQKGGDIDIFGMWNGKLPAKESVMTAYLDDVTNTTNGQRDPASNDFNAAPAGWVGLNNSFTAKDNIVRPFHEFGWARSLPFLDGLNGFSPMYTIPDTERHCMGGIIYLASDANLNVPRASYGASLNGSLNTKDHHMYVTGRVKIDWANVDAGELFGWYNSATACDDVTGGKGHSLPDKFLGVTITAGSNGYGMVPSYRSPLAREEQTLKAWNPATRVYEDGQWREFSMEYDPDGAGGRGQLKLQLGKDGTPVTYDLAEGAKGADFAFDRVGLLTHRKGGGKPHAIYFDKLTYTVAR